MSTIDGFEDNGVSRLLNGASKDAGALVDTATQDLQELGEEVKHQVADFKEEAASQIGAVAEKAKGLAAEQKDLLAEQFSGIVDAMQKVAGELENTNTASAGYVRLVADGAKKLSDTVNNNNVDDILSMAQKFGRDQPVAFMGAAALLGFAASRFALASAQRGTQKSEPSTQGGNAGGYDA